VGRIGSGVLVSAGDDDEVYDKKTQRYAETTEQHLIVRSGN